MDSLSVDMELLRRISEIRNAVEQLDEGEPGSLQNLHDAILRAGEQAGKELPDIKKLLDLMAWALDAAEPGGRTPASRLSTGILAAAEAGEQCLFEDSTEEYERLLSQAGRTLFLAVGRDPAEWEAWSPDPDVESPQASGPATAVRLEDGVSLDDIAAFMVRMDPEDRGEALHLRELLEDLGQNEGVPTGFPPLHQQMLALLDSVTTPPRVRKSVRQEAVDRVAGIMEEASLLFEEMEASEACTPDAPEEFREQTGISPETMNLDEEEESETDPDEDEFGPEAELEEASEAPGDGPQAQELFPDVEPLPETADPDLILDFVTEGFEYLEQAEEALLILEEDPDDKEAVNVVFRGFHTIKGVSGFLELHRVSNLAHHAETLLSRVREGELRYTGVVADLSLRGIDVLKALLESVRNGVKEGAIRLTPDYGPLFTILADSDLPRKIQAGTVPGMPGQVDAGALDSQARPEGGPRSGDRAPEEGSAEGSRRSNTGESSVRVRTDRLDRLVDMVGELVIAHSMLAQDPTILRDRGNLSRKVDHSAKILRELQDLSTSLRMVPMKPAFRKVIRVVRDLSKKIGKPVDLLTEGEDTEIDRTMVDVLADPLIHMVRNSLDHGLEDPDERAATGKPPRGKLRISAFQAGGNVVIEVADDGRGLNREKILAKAIERGVVESDRGMTDREIYNLIFAPGFSTAEKVTAVSGRGVGMDVVRRNVESLRGRVSIDSEPGRGSTFSIHLPLTLAITDGMVIRVGTQRFIIPSVKIHMSLRPEPKALSTVSGKGEMVLLQGRLLPIIRLHTLWNIPDAVQDPKEGLLVIVGEGRDRSALLVDELVTQQQFVVKPLSGVVSDTQGVAGGAIMGNGDVGLILDPDGIIARAQGKAQVVAA